VERDAPKLTAEYHNDFHSFVSAICVVLRVVPNLSSHLCHFLHSFYLIHSSRFWPILEHVVKSAVIGQPAVLKGPLFGSWIGVNLSSERNTTSPDKSFWTSNSRIPDCILWLNWAFCGVNVLGNQVRGELKSLGCCPTVASLGS
jgi:hypothetical protein